MVELLSVAAGVPPAVEPGILPGGLSFNDYKSAAAYRLKYFKATIKSFGQGAVIVWRAPESGWTKVTSCR